MALILVTKVTALIKVALQQIKGHLPGLDYLDWLAYRCQGDEIPDLPLLYKINFHWSTLVSFPNFIRCRKHQ